MQGWGNSKHPETYADSSMQVNVRADDQDLLLEFATERTHELLLRATALKLKSVGLAHVDNPGMGRSPWACWAAMPPRLAAPTVLPW